jgi:hypothetical protein
VNTNSGAAEPVAAGPDLIAGRMARHQLNNDFGLFMMGEKKGSKIVE